MHHTCFTQVVRTHEIFSAIVLALLLAGHALAYEHIPVPPVDESFKEPALLDLRLSFDRINGRWTARA